MGVWVGEGGCHSWPGWVGEEPRIPLIAGGRSIWLRLPASCFPVGERKGLKEVSASLLLPSHLRTSLAEATPDGRGESSSVYVKGRRRQRWAALPCCGRRMGRNFSL